MNTLLAIVASVMAFFTGLFTPYIAPEASQSVAIVASSSSEINTQSYHIDFLYKTLPDNQGVRNDHMLFISPTGEKIQIPDEIWAKIDKDSYYPKVEYKGKESLSGYTMPLNPLNKNEILLATVEYGGGLVNEGTKFILHIYSYNLKTAKLQELFSSLRNESTEITYDRGTSSVKQQIYLMPRIVGIQGTKIIFADVLAEDSPGPCIDFWRYWGRNDFLYFDITHTEQGLQKFIVPQSVLDASAQEAKECEVKEFGTLGGVLFPKGADIQSFVLTKDGIAKDFKYVYTWHKDRFDVLEGADPKTITEVGRCLRVFGEDGEETPYGRMKELSYFKDKQHIYPDLEQSTLDTDSFIYLGDYFNGSGNLGGRSVAYVAYAKDKNGVYIGCGTKMEGVDANTFSPLNYGYSKDKNHVYFLDKIVNGADPKTFIPTEPDPY